MVGEGRALRRLLQDLDSSPSHLERITDVVAAHRIEPGFDVLIVRGRAFRQPQERLLRRIRRQLDVAAQPDEIPVKRLVVGVEGRCEIHDPTYQATRTPTTWMLPTPGTNSSCSAPQNGSLCASRLHSFWFTA